MYQETDRPTDGHHDQGTNYTLSVTAKGVIYAEG